MFWFRHEQVQWLSPEMRQSRLVMKWASRGSLPFMKPLKPRKIEEVLWHSATSRLAKSILVNSPRLPTMRVIGSQFISTSWPGWLAGGFGFGIPGSGRGAGRGRRAPARRLVQRVLGELAEGLDGLAVRHQGGRGQQRAGRLVHEGLELVGETRHGTADADAADVRASPHPADRAPLADVALHHRPPAAQLDDAQRRAVDLAELALLVVAAAVAALVHRLGEEPARAEGLVERDRRRPSGELVAQVEEGLGHVVRLHRAARDA